MAVGFFREGDTEAADSSRPLIHPTGFPLFTPRGQAPSPTFVAPGHSLPVFRVTVVSLERMTGNGDGPFDYRQSLLIYPPERCQEAEEALTMYIVYQRCIAVLIGR
jgi:hypothetical protein